MEYVLGIDIGTGSVKAVAVDLQGKPFESCQQFYLYSAPKPGYHEQDPAQIWSALKDSIRALILKTGAQPLAAGLSSAMHSLIAVDENCTALAPMMTWADSRSLEIAKRLRATSEGMAIYKATGTPIHAMSPLCKLIWLRENDAELFHKTYKFIGIKEYIWHHLFKEFKIDHSIASGSGLFNLHYLDWHKDSLTLAGISAEKLSTPEPCEYTNFISGASDTGFLDIGIPFTISSGDGVLANLGSMADKPGIAAITIGTSGAVRVASSAPLPNEKAMTFSYILDKQTFVCGGPINNGGIAMQWWLRNFFGPGLTETDYEQTFHQISQVPAGSEGLIFLPYLTGERAPVWDSECNGNFFGVKLQHTRAHFSRAVMEGICFALRDVLDAVQENSGQVSQINISGGFTRSAVWVQTLADICEKKLIIVQSGDASAAGAAFMAMVAAGLSAEYPSAPAEDLKIFEPNPINAAVYRRGFKIYRRLYSDLKETMHKVFEEQ